MRFSVISQLTLILLGYIFACVVGSAAVWLRNQRIDPIDASSGMYAFGDLLLFVFVAGMVALLPTALLIRLIMQAVPLREQL